MIKDNDLDFVYNSVPGIALAWVIDEDVVYDLPLSVDHAKMFLNASSVIDISESYPDHDGITVKLIKNDEELEIFQTTEYFGSILLSNPTIINLSLHKYGTAVAAPYAKFKNYQFEILDRDASWTFGWLPQFDPENEEIIAICTKDVCNCGRLI
jgi:hypothetical protein